MKNLLKNILTLITIASVTVGILTSLGWIRQKEERQRAESNLYNRTVQWKDEKGRLVTETTELRFTNQELKKVAKKDSANLSEAEKNLLKANQLISDLRIKPQKTESVHMLGFETVSDQVTELTVENLAPKADSAVQYRVNIAPIKTKHLELIFDQVGDSLHVSHIYRTDIDVVVDRDRGLSEKGRKRFILVRWVRPKWEYSSSVVAEDPDAEIISNVYIKFQRKKGRRK